MFDIPIYIAAGAILGFLIGLTGIGAGVLTVPFLILVMRLDPVEAVGTTSLYAVFTKSYALFRHYKQKTINFKRGFRFLLITAPGVLLASSLVKWSKVTLPPEGVETLQSCISYVIIVSIGFSIIAMSIDYRKLDNTFFSSPIGKILKVICIFFIGIIIGATSIGGGILIIPALLFFYRETTRYVGTAILIAVMCMIVMSSIYALVGGNSSTPEVNFNIAAFMSMGSLFSTHYGSALCKKIDPRRLQFVIIAITVVAITMLLYDKFN